jgi:multicomponent Na+:H+ antiporter subunit D
MTELLRHSPALIPLLYLAMAILLPVISGPKARIPYLYTLGSALLATAVSLFNVVQVLDGTVIHYHFGGWIPPLGIEYVLDPLSAYVTLVINLIALLVLFHSRYPVTIEIGEKKAPFYAIVLLMLCGFNGIVLTGDFFNLYVFLEISSLALYGLVASGDRKAPVAAFRYLIMGAVAASFYLLGVGFLYMETGSLNMADLRKILPQLGDQPTVIVALSLMVMGMGIKMALFPLHGWLPDAYTYAPTTTSSLVAPTGTKVGAYVLLRIMLFVFGLKFITQVVPLGRVVSWLAALGILYGSIMAMAQKEMKRMLAYSSIAQIGYIGLGIGLGNRWALIGALFHILNHAFMKSLLFLVSGNLRLKLGHSRIDRMDHRIPKALPWTSAAFTVGALSMVGLPPTAGFFSKLYLVLGTIESSAWIFLGILLVSSLLNAVYFFRILEKMYLKPLTGEKIGSQKDKIREVPPSMLIPTLLLAAGILVIGIFSYTVVNRFLLLIIPGGM